MKHNHTTLTTLASHIIAVTQIDHYSNFLLQQMEEGTIIILNNPNSTTFVSLCVEKEDNELFLKKVSTLTADEQEEAVIFEFPTYCHEKHIREYEPYFQKEVKVLKQGSVSPRILLIWIGQSFLYRYRGKVRKTFSVRNDNYTPRTLSIVHYWLYYLYIRVVRRAR